MNTNLYVRIAALLAEPPATQGSSLLARGLGFGPNAPATVDDASRIRPLLEETLFLTEEVGNRLARHIIQDKLVESLKIGQYCCIYLKDFCSVVEFEKSYARALEELISLVGGDLLSPDISGTERYLLEQPGKLEASAFLNAHYGDVLSRIHDVQLAAHDPELVAALRMEAEQAGKTLADYVPTLEQVTEQRRGALAAVLGLSEDQLADPGITERLATYLAPELAARATSAAPGSWAERVQGEHADEAPPLPTEAPALWKEAKQKGDTPVSFIQRHYEPWLGKGLERRHLLHLDPKLYKDLSNWLARNKPPEDFLLPKKSETIDRKLASFTKDETPNDVREWRRLDQALRDRSRQK